jgi:hypothetical protein
MLGTQKKATPKRGLRRHAGPGDWAERILLGFRHGVGAVVATSIRPHERVEVLFEVGEGVEVIVVERKDAFDEVSVGHPDTRGYGCLDAAARA